MSPASRRELVEALRVRYRKASREEKAVILDGLCAAAEYHRKYAIHVLNRPVEESKRRKRKKRKPNYTARTVTVLAAIWKAAGYPCSIRLKALLPLWMPWARKHFKQLTPTLEKQLLAISPRQIDRRLRAKKLALGRRIYGRTKPGTLLKHHIPIKTHNWDVSTPGFVEADLVSHSGSDASGEFIYSLNLTDIHTAWGETVAVMGRGQRGVFEALKEIQRALPFTLRGLDCDNGSEFINHHLARYCNEQGIKLTRGRPYKKDDNAHIEQKNWTHVRKLMGWERYDSFEALDALNDLYHNELRLMMNLFQPSVKLVRKQRIGSRLKRVYDEPQTPLDRLIAAGHSDDKGLAELKALRERIDPFELSQRIGKKLERIYKLARRPPRSRSGS